MKKESVYQFFKSHLFIVSLLLLLKVVLLRFLLFQEISLLKAVALELSYIVLFAAVIELIAVKWKPGAFLLFSVLFSTLFLAVIMYHSFFGRIVTYFALFQVGQVGTISESITALLNPVYILFFADILILLVLLAFRKYPLSTKPLNAKYFVVPILLAAIVVTLVNFTSHKDELIANNVIAAEEKGILNYEALEIVFGPDSQVNAQTNVSVENAAELQKRSSGVERLRGHSG
ncbi:hypothetical protein FK545_02975 [Planococcus glaciei]|nr:hypothetical protein [Planococcus glaciei]QDY44858.1 hypothetical protein FK545_02975 [Planococcus glaciei]